MTDVNNQSVTSNTISYNWLVKPTPPVFQPATQNIVFGTNTYPQNITSLSPIGGDYPYYLTYWETSLNSTVWSSMSSGDNLFAFTHSKVPRTSYFQHFMLGKIGCHIHNK